MDNILSEIDKAYKKGISDPRFQPAIKDLEEKRSIQQYIYWFCAGT